MNTEIDGNQDESSYDELEALKARADLLGIKYHPNTGIDKLRAKINIKMVESSDIEESPSTKVTSTDYVSHTDFTKMELQNRRRKAGSLVRLIVTNMNPNKKEWEGEIISVGSAQLGTFKKYVPFNVEWHVPHIIYEAMKERKCSIFHTVKDHLGQKVRKSKLINEFNIQVLPPLSKEELKDLANQQAMSGSIES